ncbi:MAG: pantoate--beta-alanine ligase [Actinomycetota bacterium]
MITVRTRAELAQARASLTGQLGLVPTMGALHAGHGALLDAARSAADGVVVSIFVNPTQFARSEDLGRYPRPLDADLALCAHRGVDVVWVPSVAEVYPAGMPQVGIDPGPLGAELEGAVRPTHFAGVLTVVAKLFANVRPDLAFFGEKDYQQLCLVRRMTRDLDLGVGIVGVPTVREPGGLALSSRNSYLSLAEHEEALSLSAALFAGREAAPFGAAAVLAAAQAVLQGAAVRPDYLELRAADLGPVVSGDARLLIAARVGATRLIDNVGMTL